MTPEEDEADDAHATQRSGFLFFEKKAKGDVIVRDEKPRVAPAAAAAAAAANSSTHIPPPKPLSPDAKAAPKTMHKPRPPPIAKEAEVKSGEKKLKKGADELKRNLSVEDDFDVKRIRRDASSPVPAAASPGIKKTPGKTSGMQDTAASRLSRLLAGVVLVISGIGNPERATLRDLALQMGADYRPQVRILTFMKKAVACELLRWFVFFFFFFKWDNQATHLVAEFPDTAKVREAQASHGYVVTADWLRDCYSQKKRLPAEKYANRLDDCCHRSLSSLS